MMFNLQVLQQELREAGIPVLSVAADGLIQFMPEATPQQIAEADAIKAAHDPNELTITEFAAQELRAVNIQAKIDLIQQANTALANLETQINTLNALPAGTLPNVIKTPLIAALNIIRSLLEGLKDEQVEDLIRWRRLLQLVGATDDTTTNGS